MTDENSQKDASIKLLLEDVEKDAITPMQAIIPASSCSQ
jgi:hypothetical protein